MNPSNLRTRSFRPMLERAGLPRIRVHDLRHPCATLLPVQGSHPKYVQELLGHTNISTTMDTYSHVLPSMGDGSALAMENALFLSGLLHTERDRMASDLRPTLIVVGPRRGRGETPSCG